MVEVTKFVLRVGEAETRLIVFEGGCASKRRREPVRGQPRGQPSGAQIEVHLFRGPWYRLVSQVASVEDDRTDAISVDFPIPVLPDIRSELDPGITYADFYSYADLRGIASITACRSAGGS